MIEKYREELKIFNHYTDYRGQLSLKTLCDLLNEVAEEQTVLHGVDVETLNKSDKTWMLHRMHVRIDRMPSFGEKVMVETWFSGIDRLFALRDYLVLGSDGEVAVCAVSEWMLIDLQKRRPIRQTPEIVALSMEHRIEKLQMPSILDEKSIVREMEMSRNFTATFNHIDVNGHVTMTSYMWWITNSLSCDFLKKHVLKEVEIVYEQEIMPDSPICACYKLEDADGAVNVNHVIKSTEKNGREHCVAKTIWKKQCE